MTEGTIPFEGGETWYRIVGDGEEPGKLPLLASTAARARRHDYLEPLEALAATGRRVSSTTRSAAGTRGSRTRRLLDGRSLRRRGAAPSATRSASTGSTSSARRGAAMLAMEYALTQPSGRREPRPLLRPASIPLWAEETNRLRNELPDDVRRVLDEDEAPDDRLARVRGGDGGVLQAPRLPARPVARLRRCGRSPASREHPEVYMTMQGPNEFVITGTLKDWDITGGSARSRCRR